MSSVLFLLHVTIYRTTIELFIFLGLCAGMGELNSPKTGAWMNDPVAGGFLSDPLLHERLLAPEEFHREFVVRGLKERLELVLEEGLLLGADKRVRDCLLLRSAIETDIVAAEVDLAARGIFRIHVGHGIGKEIGNEERLVVERCHQGIGTRVGILDRDFDRVILVMVAQFFSRLCRAESAVGQPQTGNSPSAIAARLRRRRRCHRRCRAAPAAARIPTNRKHTRRLISASALPHYSHTHTHYNKTINQQTGK